MNKLATMKVSGGDYSKVPTRLKQFREDNPRADIQTSPTFHEDGSVTFKARIVKDQQDPNSAKGTGHARYTQNEMSKPKSFEKLETIAKGRALADIGYLNNGEIATTEEMEEFYSFKENKVEEAVELISNCSTVDELKSTFLALSGNLKAESKVFDAKEAKKKELA